MKNIKPTFSDEDRLLCKSSSKLFYVFNFAGKLSLNNFDNLYFKNQTGTGNETGTRTKNGRRKKAKKLQWQQKNI